jgi:hypothetical protein
MSNGIISLDDISGNDGSTDAQTSGSDDSDSGSDFAALESACDPIGADFENAKDAVKHRDGITEDDLIELAEKLAEDDDLWNLMEEYRTWNDQKRMILFHFRSHEKEFTNFAGAFWGDSENPDEGTYNHVEDRARDSDGNLYYYKALFPEPHMEHYPSDNAVVWQERPDEDSHIYVTAQFVDEYSDYQLEIDGQERPVPPWDGASTGTGGDSGGSGDQFDPREYTISELEEELDQFDADELEAILEVEKETKNRKGAKSALRDAIDAREESGGDESDDGDDIITVEINGNEVTGDRETVMDLMNE